jgi:hypothetical protein
MTLGSDLLLFMFIYSDIVSTPALGLGIIKDHMAYVIAVNYQTSWYHISRRCEACCL